MDRKAVLKVNVSCIRVLRTIREETSQTSQNEGHYHYACNKLNYSESMVVVAGQSSVSTQFSSESTIVVSEQSSVNAQGSENFLSSEKRIFSVDTEGQSVNDESEAQTVILSSEDEVTDKNDTDEEGFIFEKNKYYHDYDDGALSDASTVAGSVYALIDKDEYPLPEDIQMFEISSTEPVNDIIDYSPSLGLDPGLIDQVNTTEENCTDQRDSGKPTIISNEICRTKVLVYRQPVIQSVNENDSNFLGFNSHEKQETDHYLLRFEKVENGTEDLISAREGAITDLLNMSTSLTEDSSRFPRKFPFETLDDLSNFQDLSQNVKSDPIAYNFPNMIREPSISERSELPCYSYLRNNLPDQVEPFEAARPTKIYVKSPILTPHSEPKGSGYSQLIPVVQKLTIWSREELKKMHSRIRSRRKRLIQKEKLKLKKTRSKKTSPKNPKKTAKFKAKKSVWTSSKLRSAAAETIGRVSRENFRNSIKTKKIIKKDKLRKQQKSLLEETKNQRITRSFTKILDDSLKLEETPKPVPRILRSKKLSFTSGERGKNNFRNSVVSSLEGDLFLKEVRVNLIPLEFSSFKKKFENKRHISNSIFDSLVPDTNENTSEFEEYEHLKFTDTKSMKDSIDENHINEKKSLKNAILPGPKIDSSTKTNNLRRSSRIRNLKSPEKCCQRTIFSPTSRPKNHSQIRKVSKKVTFSPDITFYYIKK